MAETIVLGSDHGGFKLKNAIKTHLIDLGYTVKDLGCFTEESCDYPVIAKAVANEVLSSQNKGILVCGTGLGMSMAANRFDGIRAAVCTDTFSAKMSRLHNDANILCLGERVLGQGLAFELVDIWLNTQFLAGRHKVRIDMI
ncbi:MAG: ribose 5-phosphate isomerase B [bacterium]|nr:ribose 5-phosphate isomerase B [bacterium]